MDFFFISISLYKVPTNANVNWGDTAKKIKFRDGIELQWVGAYKIDHLLKMGYRNTSNHKNV